MKRHWSYLKYLLKHKWYVFLAGRKIGVSWFQLLIHDWQKFTPVEWFGYAKTFYHVDGKRNYNEQDETLQYAWNHHQKHCKHHWQYWDLVWDNGKNTLLKIPDKYIKEMVADWFGAGKAITGKWEAYEWYERSKHSMNIEHDSRIKIEKILRETINKFGYG